MEATEFYGYHHGHGPTCTKGDTAIYVCYCGNHVHYEWLEPLGHEVAEWTEIKAATCEEEGLRTGHCTRCGEVVTETIAKIAPAQ